MRTDQRHRRPGRTVGRQRNVRQSRDPRPPIRDEALDPDQFTQELVHERRRRCGIQPIRRIHLLDPSGTHHRDAVRHLHRLGLIVRDKDAGEPHPVMQIAQPDAQALAHLGIQRAERFVQQQQLGLDRQRARQRNTLALTAGDLLGIAVREVADAQQIQQRLHARADLALRRPLRACAHLQAKCDIALPPSCDGTARSAGTRSRRDARAPARRASSGRPMTMSPESTNSRPASTRSSVVLPEPDGPSSARNSPGATVSDTPSSAATPLNDLRRSRNSTFTAMPRCVRRCAIPAPPSPPASPAPAATASRRW